MIKLALLIILMAPALLPAQELCTSAWTVQSVSVASHTATQIDSAARVLPGRKWVEVQRDSSTDTIRCSYDTSVSHTVGRMITTTEWAPPLGDGDDYVVVMSTFSPHIYSRTQQRVSLYCINAGTNTLGKVTLSQCK